jgi:hypothetical protein
MANKKNIDELVSRILEEEIEKKAEEIYNQLNEGEWTEIEMDEELHGGQKKIDVAEPKGKITGADFKKLRDAKKHKEEVEEWFFYDDEEDESTPGDYEGDEDAEEEAEELSSQEPTYVGRGLKDNKLKSAIRSKMIGSFDDEHGWFDEMDRQIDPDTFEDYDEEEFHDFPSLYNKHRHNQKWFAPREGEKFFDIYKKKFGDKPFRVRTSKGLEEEAETEEGNAFSGALAHAKEAGRDSFEVDGKKYPVKEAKEKWIQKTDMKKGGLHKKLGVPEGEKIPKTLLNKLKKDLMAKSKGDKKLSAADSKLLKQVNLALTLKDIKENKETLRLTENELIDMIEQIIIEQKVADKAEKNTFAKKSPEGLKKTEKVLATNKKENEGYFKELVKKMKDYLKDGSKGEYSENPEEFPRSNYQMDKDDKIMKYNPSEAVDEYIEAFSYPGQTNIVYDEIKPDDKKIDKYLKGDSTTGNAVKDKDGKAYGNVVPSKVGDRFKKNYDENLYGQEQMKASYKRQPQPVDVAGDSRLSGHLNKGKGKKTPESILNKLDESNEKKAKIITEEMDKMKNLIGYNRKTQ